MESLTISGFGWARRKKRQFTHIISCLDPAQPAHDNHIITFHHRPAPETLTLRFADLSGDPPYGYDNDPHFEMPSRGHVTKALQFARTAEKLLVHSIEGVGRCSGLGLVILADTLGPGRETEAVEKLFDLRSIAVPNRQIVAIGDDLLHRKGRLLQALWEYERANRPNAERYRVDARRRICSAYGAPL